MTPNRSDAGTSSQVQLWCIPGAGGSAASFSQWGERLGPMIRVLPLELPGHGRRICDRPIRNLADVAADLLAVIRPALSGRFAFFGHSLGSLLATECCRRLEDEQAAVAEHLFVGSGMPPHRLPPECPRRHSSDAELLAHLRELEGTPPELLEDAGFRAMLFPALRADFEILEAYRFRPEASPPLRCPITAVGGRSDCCVEPAILGEWKLHTASAFDIRVFEGGHFASIRSPEMTRLIANTLHATTAVAHRPEPRFVSL